MNFKKDKVIFLDWRIQFFFIINSIYAKWFTFTLIQHHKFTKLCSNKKIDESVFAHYDWYTISDALDISITLHKTSAGTLIKFNYIRKYEWLNYIQIVPIDRDSTYVKFLLLTDLNVNSH